MTTYLIDKGATDRRRERRTNASRDERRTHEIGREQPRSPNIDQTLDDSFPASDPPSWTGAISRVAHTSERHPHHERLARRIRAEFLDMPGLRLTVEQAQRLWSLEPGVCEAVLNSLIDSRFLRRTKRGLFARRA